MLDNDRSIQLLPAQGRMSVRRNGVLSRRGNWGVVYAAAFLLAGLAGCGPEQSDLVKPNSVAVSLNITMPDKTAAASSTQKTFWATLQRWLFPTEAWAAGGRTDLAILRVEVSAADLLTPVSGEVSVPSTGNVVTIPLDVPVGADRVFTASGLDGTRARIFLAESGAVTLNAGQAITVDIDLAAGKVGAVGSLTDARALHTATLLQNGKVLVVGGDDCEDECELDSVEQFDPVKQQWEKLPTGLNVPRISHTATLLLNGKVLIVGDDFSPLASVEQFDPVKQQWEQLPTGLSDARGSHTATLLQNGKVLVVGGSGANGLLTSAELYDPTTNGWTRVAAGLTNARADHTATMLRNGQVLVVGGFGVQFSPLVSAELFDTATQQWTLVGSLKDARQNHTATLLQNEKVLVVGGFNQQLQSIRTSAELFDPVTQQWTDVGGLKDARQNHTATLLQNGKVLVVGGFGVNGSLVSAELFDPVTQQWQRLATGLTDGRANHTATLLPNSQVLVVGGQNGPLASAELLDLSLL